ncbi:thiamine pyrophosphate-dependent dehydrogenase E1 component subunit alpha, partial [Porticoccaceae bacterium]|nr:thiamine pyrophosphate-dependent dehydrogenase E1 component subunit alpha [Porticoccaceae bacterium]
MVDKNLVTSVLKFTETKDMPISTLSLLNTDGEILEGVQEPKIDKNTALKIYRDMNYIRVLDERMIGA